ncbi:MAG: DUF1499 domain-containing protein [Cyanobacteria bacterium SID2]|nr:DUF1499 domain-containing protein [Cyanobacteria bacterium SID2]MBP0003510.1 DUF1499 domain-containing protein [Cyanobacteria bacterium SBC]
MLDRLRVIAVTVGLSLLWGSIAVLSLVPAAVAAPNPPVQVASLFHFSGKRPDLLGFKDGKLAPCPASPNCVSSQSEDTAHYIEPLAYEASPEDTIERLKNILKSTDNTQIVVEKPNYLYAEFTSNIMGFIDDVEFLVDDDEALVHVRSASRLGESDLGVNRQRIETIRQRLNS